MDIILGWEHYRNLPHLNSVIAPGFIQEYSFSPFNVSLYTERQFRLLKSYLAYNPNGVLTLDATGKIVATLPERYSDKAVYYYALVINLPGGQESPTVPVFEYVTNNQTAWNNSHMLHAFFRRCVLNKI